MRPGILQPRPPTVRAPPDEPPPAMEAKDLRFTYPDGTAVLRGVDFTVRPGRVGGTSSGPNGAGKSTLLLHLNGILRGTGDLRVLGLSLSTARICARSGAGWASSFKTPRISSS